MRPLQERYDGLKRLEFPLFLLKIRPIARLLPSLFSRNREDYARFSLAILSCKGLKMKSLHSQRWLR